MSSAKPELYDVGQTGAPPDLNASTHKGAIRIILADSQAVYRLGILKILTLEDDIRLIAQTDTLSGLQGAIQRFPTTDMILLEWNLVAGSLDTIDELLRTAPQRKIIIYSDQNDRTDTVDLYLRGVRGVIPRSISPDFLVKCVRKVAAGETWIDNQSINSVIEACRTAPTALTQPRTEAYLTPKELAIITCVGQGKRNKQVAYELGTTEQVIKNYLRKVFDKLGVSDRIELALYCLRHGLHKKSVGTLPRTGERSMPLSKRVPENSTGHKIAR
jgi:DNA-binding NarL/FixJ family response regulator